MVLCTKRVSHCYQFYAFLYLTSSKNHCNKDFWKSWISTEWSKDKPHNPTSKAIPARVALDGNEYLQKSPTLSSEPKKTELQLCQELVFALWFCFNGGYRVRPLIFRLLCNAKPVTKSCLVSRLFPREMEDKNNSLNLTNVVSAACWLRTPIDHSSFRTSVTLQSLQTS
jgi:hypothetical protein